MAVSSGELPCVRCGAPIQVIEGPHGTKIPVQRVRLLYTLNPGATRLGEIESRPEEFWVYHPETCFVHGRKGRT